MPAAALDSASADKIALHVGEAAPTAIIKRQVLVPAPAHGSASERN